MAAAKTPNQSGASAQTTGGNASSGARPPGSTPTPVSAASNGSSAAKPLIPSAHTPTPAQQSPNVRRPLAPYLPEANPNAPKDPAQAMAERTRAAIESRLPKNRTQNTSAASAPSSTASSTTSKTLPAQSSAPSEKVSKTGSETASPEPKPGQPPSTEDTSTPSSSPPKSETVEASPVAPDATADASTAQKRGPRYEIKAMKKWAEENPEQAAELRVHVFGYDPESNEGYIKLTNKRRAIRKEIDEHRTKSLAEIEAEKASVKAYAEKAESTAKTIAPLMDLWEAAKRVDQHGNPMPDFDAGDAAFLQIAKMPIDDYMRLRARRGVANPEMARLRAENARLKAQGAPATASPATPPQSNGAAAPAQTPAVSPPAAVEAPKPAAPAELEAKWSPELPKDHRLRMIQGWAAKLDAEMQRYHDDTLDEYSRDPEEVAGIVLKRALAELAGEDETDEVQVVPKSRGPQKKLSPPTQRKRATFAPPEHAELMQNPSRLAPRVDSVRATRNGLREGFEDYGTSENPRDPLIKDRPEKFGDRTQWAIARAQARARGESLE